MEIGLRSAAIDRCLIKLTKVHPQQMWQRQTLECWVARFGCNPAPSQSGLPACGGACKSVECLVSWINFSQLLVR